MLERARHALLALLTKQLKVNGSGLLLRVELDPEDHPAFHRRPGVTTVLDTHSTLTVKVNSSSANQELLYD